MVVLCFVDDVFGVDFGCSCVADGDVFVVDDHEYGCAFVGSSDAEVFEFCGVAECEFSVVVDDVGAGA